MLCSAIPVACLHALSRHSGAAEHISSVELPSPSPPSPSPPHPHSPFIIAPPTPPSPPSPSPSQVLASPNKAGAVLRQGHVSMDTLASHDPRQSHTKPAMSAAVGPGTYPSYAREWGRGHTWAHLEGCGHVGVRQGVGNMQPRTGGERAGETWFWVLHMYGWGRRHMRDA